MHCLWQLISSGKRIFYFVSGGWFPLSKTIDFVRKDDFLFCLQRMICIVYDNWFCEGRLFSILYPEDDFHHLWQLFLSGKMIFYFVSRGNFLFCLQMMISILWQLILSGKIIFNLYLEHDSHCLQQVILSGKEIFHFVSTRWFPPFMTIVFVRKVNSPFCFLKIISIVSNLLALEQ